ncbi:MAG: nicotinic acid mononucleotide adenylyltransferase [Acidobacteria bacterium]|nr:MAG: nicotinic acid mononucleotide adenylyltransferase [Acidobacteriota bacterium]
MGGTFDPIHLGHLRAAENAREGLGLDEVRFLPAQVPPHRTAPASSARDRYAMVALATALNPLFVADDLELRREGPSYTVDTIARLRDERPGDAVVLIVGSDTFPELPTWKDHDRILRMCTVAVVTRPEDGREDGGHGQPPTGGRGQPESPLRIEERAEDVRVPGPGLAVSATDIRRRVKEGLSIRYLVPETVADYIAKRGLYR